MRRGACLFAALGVMLAGSAAVASRPSVLLISVDTLRADRLSSYGYVRATSPHLDRLLAGGVRFTEARTIEPLTAPALASMLTSLHPHEHGSTRNGLRVRDDLPSMPRILRRGGYRAAAFVGSWTLREALWGMAEHFDVYEEVLNRARWFGLVRREATAEDLNERASDWLAEHSAAEPGRPFFLWVHYVEPHAPYKLQREYLPQLGAAPDGDLYSASGRYDTEIAYVDAAIARLVERVGESAAGESLITVLVADHGESLGEHGYWGHGRHLYDATLRVPMGIVWPGRIAPRVEDAPALIIDLAPTLLGLLGIEVPPYFQGADWSDFLLGGGSMSHERVTHYQAHKGATSPKEDGASIRQRGLLEVARLQAGRKEILRVTNRRRRVFELVDDPGEERSLAPLQSDASPELAEWLTVVEEGLVVSDALPPPSLTDEDVENLRALGYVD